MKYLEEYRDHELVKRLAGEIRRITTKPWTLMEVCGGQTHSILKFGLEEILPPEISLIHGPGCPVCVTAVEVIDQAHRLAMRPGIIFCSFGDMLRVPGSRTDLLSIRASGADVRVVYSPLDAVKLAMVNPAREVVFFGVGFETTAPVTALAVKQASARGLTNFSLLPAHVLVPPAIRGVLESPGCRVQGFLAAGHVCSIMGHEEYQPICEAFRVPIVVTGFEPVDILDGVLRCVRQLESGRAGVENAYGRAVRTAGNQVARAAVHEVYEVVPRAWRGLGLIPSSGLGLREEFARFDAARRFDLSGDPGVESADCLMGKVLQGRIKPPECPHFGNRCTPDHPMGATMVSSEGACAAYYRYRGGER